MSVKLKSFIFSISSVYPKSDLFASPKSSFLFLIASSTVSLLIGLNRMNTFGDSQKLVWGHTMGNWANDDNSFVEFISKTDTSFICMLVSAILSWV